MTQALVRRNEVIVRDDRDELAMVLRVQHERGRLLCPPERVFYRQRADSSWWVKVPMLMPAKPEKPARRSGADETLAAIGKALLWVAGLTAIGLTFVYIAFLILRDALSEVNWPAIGLVVLALGLIVAIGTSRAKSHGHSDGWGFHWSRCK